MQLGTSISRIISVNAETYRVELEYDDGFRGTVDLSFLFHSPKGKPMVSEIIQGGLFEKCFLVSGALVWPNGYELCPDAIRGWISDPSDVRAP